MFSIFVDNLKKKDLMFVWGSAYAEDFPVVTILYYNSTAKCVKIRSDGNL